MYTRTALLLLFSSLLHSSFAQPSALVSRDDPDDIMMFDCTDDDGGTLVDLCKSMCFGSFCAGNQQSLVWDKPTGTVARQRAAAAGCRPNPNRCSKSPYGSTYECDEFPFKSVENVSGGTRVNRCIAKKQNQAQGKIVKAFYANKDYCNGSPPCTFNTGYENSGDISYCNGGSCTNDGNEYTKGGQFRRGIDGDSAAVLFASSNSSSITYPTRFLTSNGTEVVIPQGAKVGDTAHRVTIPDADAWNAYIEKSMASQANMTEDEYWEDVVAPAEDELMSLLNFQKTTITAVLPDN